MSTYLVTGGAGFIGSHIVEQLVSRGEAVRVIDNLATGNMENIAPYKGVIEFIHGSILDDDVLGEAIRGVDYVLHHAALPSVPRSLLDPLASHEANATGTLRVLLAARDAGVKRVVYASSSSVYGDSPTLPKSEDMPTRPQSPYAVNKLAGEEYCKVITRNFGLPAVALRYFNVFGPRQDPNSQYAAVVPAFVAAALEGNQPIIYGDGRQTRDFTYVSNIVHANLLACSTDQADGLALNIAGGRRVSLLELLSAVDGFLGTQTKPRFEPARTGDVRDSLADLRLADARVGYKPIFAFEEGLQKTITYMQAGRNTDATAASKSKAKK